MHYFAHFRLTLDALLGDIICNRGLPLFLTPHQTQIGSQNLYIADLAEWGIIVDDEAQTLKTLEEYWKIPLLRPYQKRRLDLSKVLA